MNYTSDFIKNTRMKKVDLKIISKFHDEIRKEINLVTWPTKKEMVTAIAVVGISALLAGSIFFAIDYLLYNAVQFLIKL